MVQSIPSLRRFAVSLAGAQQADDLVQQTLLKACSKIELFDSRCEILPWLMTILRNQFYSDCRKRGRELEDVDGANAQTLVIGPNQVAYTELKDLQKALLMLPREMREAVIAVGWEGLSYADAAAAFDCPIGTVRSRVHRARGCLAALLTDRFGAAARKMPMRIPTLLLASALALAPLRPGFAERADMPVCKAGPSAVSTVISQTTAQFKLLADSSGDEKCAAYRRYFFSMVKTREMFAPCSAGPDRDRGLARLDRAIEETNSGIAESCSLQ